MDGRLDCEGRERDRREREALIHILFAEKYFELIKERKVKGYLGQEKNYFSGESGKSA